MVCGNSVFFTQNRKPSEEAQKDFNADGDKKKKLCRKKSTCAGVFVACEEIFDHLLRNSVELKEATTNEIYVWAGLGRLTCI